MAAFQDVAQNPANISKYQGNPKIMALINKLSSKFSGPQAWSAQLRVFSDEVNALK